MVRNSHVDVFSLNGEAGWNHGRYVLRAVVDIFDTRLLAQSGRITRATVHTRQATTEESYSAKRREENSPPLKSTSTIVNPAATRVKPVASIPQDKDTSYPESAALTTHLL